MDQKTSKTRKCAADKIIIECSDEMEQQDIFERLSSEGLKCRRLAPL